MQAGNTRAPPFIADAITARQINAFLHTNYRIEEIREWPEHQIDELMAAIKMLNQ